MPLPFNVLTMMADVCVFNDDALAAGRRFSDDTFLMVAFDESMVGMTMM